MRRKAAADRAEKVSNQRPSSTRAAGAGGSSSTMLSKFHLERKFEKKDVHYDANIASSKSRNKAREEESFRAATLY
jgi:hypothetical protein